MMLNCVETLVSASPIADTSTDPMLIVDDVDDARALSAALPPLAAALDAIDDLVLARKWAAQAVADADDPGCSAAAVARGAVPAGPVLEEVAAGAEKPAPPLDPAVVGDAAAAGEDAGAAAGGAVAAGCGMAGCDRHAPVCVMNRECAMHM